MAIAPEKVPIMTRLGRHLERHGLSFGDALNVLLFVLTIVSLVVAILGVVVARITLDEARNAGRDQDRQFQKQMEQLGKASDILQKLQETSDKELKDLNAAEDRIRARPNPHIRGYCYGYYASDGEAYVRISFLEVSGDDIKPIRFKGGVSLEVGYDNTVTLWKGREHELQCGVEVTNDANGELRNLELRASASWSAKNLITKVNGDPNSDDSPKLISGRDVPPKSSSNRSVQATFVIDCRTPCASHTPKDDPTITPGLVIDMTLQADNFPTKFLRTWVNLRERFYP